MKTLFQRLMAWVARGNQFKISENEVMIIGSPINPVGQLAFVVIAKDAADNAAKPIDSKTTHS